MSATRVRMGLGIVLLGVLMLGLTPYPRDFVEAVRRAETHRSALEYGAALEAYGLAARADPRTPLPWLRQGKILLQQQRWAEAEVAFAEAGRRQGGLEALLGRGESQAGRGDWAAAARTWLRALTLAPEEPRVFLALGRAAITQGRFDEAQQRLERAISLHPWPETAREAHALLGRLLLTDDPETAVAHLEQAGDLDLLAVLEAAQAQTSPGSQALLAGVALLQRREPSLARHYLEHAAVVAPTDARARAYLAYTLDQLGETAAARDLLEQALQIDAGEAMAHYFLGLHERNMGRLEKAQEAFGQALRLDPENAAFHVEMAETFLLLGDYEQAEEWYQAAADLGEDHIDFSLLLTRFYLDHLYRVEEKGLPAAQSTVALAPENAQAHDLLGWAHYLAGSPLDAQQSLATALSLDPYLVSAHYHLGSVYATTGSKALARQHLQRVADLDTGGYYRRRALATLEDLN